MVLIRTESTPVVLEHGVPAAAPAAVAQQGREPPAGDYMSGPARTGTDPGPNLRTRVPVNSIDGTARLGVLGKAPTPGAGWDRTGTVVRHNGALCFRDDFTQGQPMVRLSPSVDLPEGTIIRVALEKRGAHLSARPHPGQLASPNSPKAQMFAIAAQQGLDPEFSPQVLAEVAKIEANPGIDDPTLDDLTDKPFVTIDYESSKDLDQAMCIEKNAHGGHDIYYALADASYYVNPDNAALFAEGMRRGTSFYLPGLTIPMLPKQLSEGIVSLNAGVDRRSIVFKMSLDKDGKLLETDVSRARIHCRKKLTYDGVQEMHDHIQKRAAGVATGVHPLEKDAEKLGYLDTLMDLQDVGLARMNDAAERDVVRLHRTPVDVKIEGSDEKATFILVADERNEVEKWNEQVSLLCNIEGALALKAGLGDADLQAVFRVHDEPPKRKLHKLQNFIEGLVRDRGLDKKVWGWNRAGGESLADYLARLPTEGEGWRTTIAVHRQAMMSNVGSVFSSEVAGHYGIGADAYARFSAPMREMVGIFTHKEMIELLWDAKGTPLDDAYRTAIIERANQTKRAQKAATKAANKIAIDATFGRELDKPIDQRAIQRGTVMGFSKTRLYVQLDDPPIEVKVYLDDLEKQTGRCLAANDDNTCLVETPGADRKPGADNKWAIGEAIDVRVAGYDEKAERWLIEPVIGAAI